MSKFNLRTNEINSIRLYTEENFRKISVYLGLPKLKIQASSHNSGYTAKIIKNRVSHRYLHTHAYSNIIHNSQKVETQAPIYKWIKCGRYIQWNTIRP